MMTTIVLSRKQLAQIAEIADRYKDIKLFTIDSKSLSGIGPSISVGVGFDLFDRTDTLIDITDVDTW